MTKIEWANETLNPFHGCTKCSPGCIECYAEKMTRRLAGMGKYCYKGIIDECGKWNGTVTFNPSVMEKALNWKKPKMIFINSMSDTFHEKVYPVWLAMIFDVMARCPQHTFLILTKRPEIALEHKNNLMLEPYFGMKNIWFGVTAENQEMAEKRIPVLLQIPAAKRFVSIEPMLDGIYLIPDWRMKLDWVICGGMSGTDKYPIEPVWVRFLQKQCENANVPFLFKQWGGRNKKANGRLLDGLLYDEYPEHQ